MKIMILGVEYVNERCPTCGTVHIVKVEDVGRWKTCQRCSG